jgi:peptidyl-prolyl cis-trans isomerase D
MLNAFRSRGLMNVVYGVVIVAMILVFVIQFRPNANQKSAALKQACAATVHGWCIDPKDFSAVYRLLVPQGPNGPNMAQARAMHLKKVVLDGLVERELLVGEAERLGITATEDEVTDQIYDGIIRLSLPSDDPALVRRFFGDHDMLKQADFRDPKTGKFDIKTYERRVRQFTGRSPTEFREEQERELRAAKVRDLIRAPIRVSEAEALEQYQRDYSTAKIQYVEIKPSFAERWVVTMNDADVAAWAKDHQPEIDKEIERRKTEDMPKPGHVRHILAGFPQGATDDEKGAALAKITQAWNRIKGGEPFAEVARDMGEDGTKERGGDLGDKTDGFVAPFKQAADALKPGEMTAGAIETQFGYHLIVKDDPAKAEEVEPALKKWVPRSMYRKAKAAEAAKEMAGKIAASMKGGKSAEDAIHDAIAPYVKPATAVDPIKIIAEEPVAADAGATREATDAGTPDPTVEDAGTAATKKVTRPTTVKPVTADTDPERPQVKSSTEFNQGGEPIVGLEPTVNANVVKFAFSAKDGETMADPIFGNGNVYVVQLKEHKMVTREEFEKDRDTHMAQLLSAKQAEALSLYVKRLREASKDAIKVDESYIREEAKDGGTSSPLDEDEGY